MVCFTSGYEFCHWRIHWKLFENHLIKWERPLEQFKINLTNSLELDLIWQPVSSKLLTFWLPVSLSLSAVTKSLPKSGCLSKKWSQTSQLGCCLGLKSAPSSQLTSLSFNSFSVLHTSFFFRMSALCKWGSCRSTWDGSSQSSKILLHPCSDLPDSKMILRQVYLPFHVTF